MVAVPKSSNGSSQRNIATHATEQTESRMPGGRMSICQTVQKLKNVVWQQLQLPAGTGHCSMIKWLGITCFCLHHHSM
jgi:hypothetical protein